MYSKEALISAVKELLRVVVLAIIPVLITALETGVVDLKVVGVIAALAALRFIDKLLHEVNKELPKKKQNKGLLGEKGITGF